jgi:hypothetical protein
MGLTLNANDAKKADNFATVIRETGKYVGTITRAEKLLSTNGVEGVGFSFKTDDGASASFLDVYTVKPDGEKLRGYNIVQALLCCTRVRNADEGQINFQKWDSDARQLVSATATGYPALMGKRIGLVLQRELGTNQNTGADTDRMNIVAVFEANTGLMASEILDQKTKAEKLENVVKMVMANPIRDTRKQRQSRPAQDHGPAPTGGFDNSGFSDDIPF